MGFSKALATATLLFSVTPLISAGIEHIHSPSTVRHRRQTIPTVLPGNWTSQGCVTEGTTGRALTAATYASGEAMTIQSCINFCDAQGAIYAGVEYSVLCGNTLSNGGGLTAPTSECNMRCSGDIAQPCGGPGRLNLFWSGATPPPPPSTAPQIGDWESLGCYSDNVGGVRTLANGVAACFNAGYPLAGSEYANECFCGRNLAAGGAVTPAADCSMTCAGNSSEFCGGPNRLNVYNYTGTALPPGGVAPGAPLPVTSGLPTNWTYGGCFVDNQVGRVMLDNKGASAQQTAQTCINACAASGFTLAGVEFANECWCSNTLVNGAEKVLDGQCSMGCAGNATQACGGPNLLSVWTSTGNVTVQPIPVIQTTNLPGQYQYRGCLVEAILWERNNSASACMTQCAKFGYPVSATEYGYECYCGDESDITKLNGVWVDDDECDMPCPGDPAHICGAGNRLTTYFWNGSLQEWKTPAVTGRYEHCHPLITTVGINNKVTVLENTELAHGHDSYENSTGAYEIDISLAMKVKTDVFCAEGRQLNVGGWSLESTSGTNSTNDWEEDFNTLALQRGRWYPTAHLANGTVLVIGGETGSNGPPQPNLELLPKPVGGDTVVHLPWLERSDPYNLYPSLSSSPARILEPVNFQTIKELPNMPGAVNDFLGGRTYPLEGAMVPIPQHYPYTDPLEILMCGGSTIGAAYALDNCVRGAPEATNMEWTLERMPSRRVMSCMASLPDGTFLIVNGAHHGNAGFGLAEDPNLQALLYDPYEPLHHRVSILNSTTIPRLYHSEATLLADGRVLISGSDPETNWPNGTARYPQEFRLEVYVPPYLIGRTQPTFDIVDTDWAYGSTHTITNIVAAHGGPIRVSLLGAASSTHGNTMGARTIFPRVECSGTSCTITAPPNAGVSPPGWHMLFVLDGPTPSKAKWVRIGGDPAQIGNWPALPGFTPPGI
ncbi:copper radical oxidase [Coprinopsis sp. MPI-PUGE-AT-0042]|nr:copper radical oxidase [Coprinopsis sp. MPI-PUGE-AT-0042]